MAMIEVLVKQDIGAKCKEELNTALQQINELDAHQAQDMFPICKVEKCHKSSTAKIMFTCRDLSTRQKIMAVLNCANKPACLGPAPAGFVEDELALYMDALMSDGARVLPVWQTTPLIWR
eukprot:3343428-Pyramimonas_sp.AAC.1